MELDDLIISRINILSFCKFPQNPYNFVTLKVRQHMGVVKLASSCQGSNSFMYIILTVFKYIHVHKTYTATKFSNIFLTSFLVHHTTLTVSW